MKSSLYIALGTIIIVPILFLLVSTIITPITLSGLGYLVGFLLVAVGCLTVPWRQGRFWGVGWAGVGLVAATAVFRILLVSQNQTIYLVTLPDGGNGRIFNSLMDEQDIVLFGFRPAAALGLITNREAQGGLPVFTSLYQEMRQTDGITPSPVATTYLGLERPTRFDVLIIEPEQATGTAVLFLHGFGGNFTLQCWLVARAARLVGAVTVCPSARWVGDWWTAEGETAVRITLDFLHNRGIQHIVLAGLSNGGVGASELAPRLAGQLDGLVLISGVNPEAENSGLPVLLLHGLEDERMPASLAANYAARIGSNATYVPMVGDHFLAAKRAEAVQETIAGWLVSIWEQ